jgi:hypothetical protein
MAALSAGDPNLALQAVGLWSNRRARIAILVVVAIDAGLAAFSLGHMFRLDPTVRTLEWPSQAASAALFLAPGLIAAYSAVTRTNLLGVAIVLNFTTLFAFPQSLMVAPIMFVPIFLLLFAWASMRWKRRTPRPVLRAAAVLPGLGAALVLSLAPSRHVLWSTASNQGHVVEAQATLVAGCPGSFGQTLTGNEDSGSDGCDPMPAARAAEASLMLSTFAGLIALGSTAREESTKGSHALS